jgi:hypothetical protein
LSVEDVQLHLESIYEVRSELRAKDFVVNEQVARALGATGQADEELLVHEAEDGTLELALYLAPALLKRFSGLTADALGEELGCYCQVAEGVSHFLYVSQTVDQERRVSLLELEAQAEVDKFATCLLRRWKDRAQGWAGELHHRLFERVSYLKHLGERERWRYEEANRLAKNYCRRLMPLFNEGKLEPLLRELRYCYRLGAEAKLNRFSK